MLCGLERAARHSGIGNGINGKLDAVLGIQEEKREEKDVKDRGGKEKVEERRGGKGKFTSPPNPKNL